MKRFVLFSWTDHEASGGWHDFEADFDRLEDAVAQGKAGERAVDNWHCWCVVDMDSRKIVAEID